MQPDTRYAKSSDGVNIAYQVLGDKPRDLVMVPGWIWLGAGEAPRGGLLPR